VTDLSQGGSGHCLCGAVRYAFDAAPNWQAHCHCESCRRATSSPYTSYFGVSHGHWRWTGETPKVFMSSPGVKRHFCGTCGSPMAFEGDRWPHEIHFFAATLDDPAAFRPAAHANWNEHLPWVNPDDGLPRMRTPRRLHPGEDMAAVLRLVQDSFAFMQGRIDPPSSATRLTAAGIARQAAEGEVWVLDDLGVPVACLFLTPKTDCLYLGKLAVDARFRRQGLAQALVRHAESRAKLLVLAVLELQTRVELTENHAAFRAMGFAETGRTAHEGFDRPTTITFRKPVA